MKAKQQQRILTHMRMHMQPRLAPTSPISVYVVTEIASSYPTPPQSTTTELGILLRICPRRCAITQQFSDSPRATLPLLRATPVVMITVPFAAVLIRYLVAVAEAATEIVTGPGRNIRTTKIPMTVRIRWKPVIQVIMRGLDSGVKSLALDIVIFVGRLLPSQVEADLRLRLGHRHRARDHSHG